MTAPFWAASERAKGLVLHLQSSQEKEAELPGRRTGSTPGLGKTWGPEVCLLQLALNLRWAAGAKVGRTWRSREIQRFA